MKKLLGVVIIFVFCLIVSAQAARSQSKQSKTEAELMQLERDIGEANIKRDKPFFQRVEADEFIFTDSSGGVTNKTEDVAGLDQPVGDTKLVSYVVDGMKVFVYGKTAVVTGRVTTTSRRKDTDIVNRSRFTDVFVKRGGRWQIVAGHSSRIREPQK